MLTLKDALPCPFCGGTKFRFEDIGGVSYKLVGCKTCGAEGPDEREDEIESSAVARWNRRVHEHIGVQDLLLARAADMLNNSPSMPAMELGNEITQFRRRNQSTG